MTPVADATIKLKAVRSSRRVLLVTAECACGNAIAEASFKTKELVRLTEPGKNALDFHIAYYLGQLALKEPDAFFHIVSKDTGFDPLIQHLNGLLRPHGGRVVVVRESPAGFRRALFRGPSPPSRAVDRCDLRAVRGALGGVPGVGAAAERARGGEGDALAAARRAV